jgi:hypothetical protein
MANFVVGLRESGVNGVLLSLLLRRLGLPIDEGALDDLATGSPAINAIGQCPVPAHALVGIGGSEALAAAGGRLGAFYTAVGFFGTTTGSQLFQGLQHDYVVGRDSQEGGLPAAASTVFGAPDGIHTSNTLSQLYSDRIVDLLDTPVGAGEFGMLPPPNTLLASVTTRVAAVSAKGVTPGVTITSPAPGTTVTPGQTLTVTVEPNTGVSVDSVLLVGPDVAQRDDGPPFTFSFPIPITWVGPYVLTAAGSNKSGEYFSSNSVALSVEPQATLQSVKVVPVEVALVGLGDFARIHVLGYYSDGVARDVTALSQFQSADPQIASIAADGLVTANSLGATAITASLSAMGADARVVVSSTALSLLLDGFESGDLRAWTALEP